MILNNLAVILAEKKLTATRVSKDTGISRSTLSALVNNTGEGIQLKTLDTLCVYLGISTNDFFELYPYSVDIDLDVTNFDYAFQFDDYDYSRFDGMKVTDLSFDLLLTVKGKNNTTSKMDFIGKIVNQTIRMFYEQSINENILEFTVNAKLDIANKEKEGSFSSWWENVPESFQGEIRELITNAVKKNIDKAINSTFEYELPFTIEFDEHGCEVNIFSNFLGYPTENDDVYFDSLPF
ncbi:MAG: helix-turn-helix transcriptional regulator [Streptococcaceae bacterium]|jgi:DNA-binding Xre family transcriptional regulator|nr:helix-turn-helix transcriptional regulator [Streptococcaceae bacterium]